MAEREVGRTRLACLRMVACAIEINLPGSVRARAEEQTRRRTRSLNDSILFSGKHSWASNPPWSPFLSPFQRCSVLCWAVLGCAVSYFDLLCCVELLATRSLSKEQAVPLEQRIAFEARPLP